MYKASGLSYDIIILVKIYPISYIISNKRDISAEDQSVFLYCRLGAEVKSVSLALLSLDQIRKYAVLPTLVCCNIQIASQSVSQSVSNVECLSLSSQLLTNLMHLSTAHSEPLHCCNILNKYKLPFNTISYESWRMMKNIGKK